MLDTSREGGSPSVAGPSRPVTVYVDPAIWPWRGRRWCHLRADDPEELFAFAALLGLPRPWLQTTPGRPWKDHYDLPEDLRFQAVALGAVEIDVTGAARLTRRLRDRHEARGTAEDGAPPDPAPSRAR